MTDTSGRSALQKQLLGAGVILAIAVVAFIGWRANALNIRGATAWSVAAAFDDPPRNPPGHYIWTRAGRAVPANELVAFGGPDHCGWQAAVFLHIGWPPGTFAETIASARQYVRDPRGVITHDPSVRDRFARGVALPTDAKPTGYRLGAIELYLSPSDEDRWIYLVSPRDVERWPGTDPPIGCM